jgi:hypothetical protein
MTDDAAEREKLLRARHEVLEVLKRYDLCANVFLIGRHQMEVILHLDAAWSRLSLARDADGNEGLRLRSKAADYGGDKEAQRQELEATVGMVSAMGELLGHGAMAWLAASEQFNNATGAEHTPLTRVLKQ